MGCLKGPRWIITKNYGKNEFDFQKGERIFKKGCRIDATFTSQDRCAPMGEQKMQWQWCGKGERDSRPFGGYWQTHSCTFSDTKSNTEEENEENNDDAEQGNE